jgi:hypothetical protein
MDHPARFALTQARSFAKSCGSALNSSRRSRRRVLTGRGLRGSFVVMLAQAVLTTLNRCRRAFENLAWGRELPAGRFLSNWM